MERYSGYENYIKDLTQTDLFSNITLNELTNLLKCIYAGCANYRKDDFIIEKGNTVSAFGVMLSGQSRSIKWDLSGRLIILTFIEKGSVIGAMVAAKAEHISPVSVQATEDSVVMLIPFNRIITRCKNNCPQHEQLLRNYISVVAEKGLELYERIDCLLEPTVRDKILTYLSRISREQHSQTFTIPINRNAMAEYLNIERSALSRELSSMKKDGLIDYHKSCFRLLHCY
ncbi:MAG: Crp/Fnr family transcriptional regulator [Defluviitaleaceae bacterium]|nr:Crp/Fnr family transcriptional regulator [Defluviitaleaceae bacterium]